MYNDLSSVPEKGLTAYFLNNLNVLLLITLRPPFFKNVTEILS